VKFAVPAAVVVAALSVVGCKSNNPNKPASEPTPSVVENLNPAPAQAPAQQPVIVQPAPPAEAPMKEAPMAPAASSKAPISGHKYTVKSGDTLYNIAVRKYGHGTQANINKITKANPGLKPETLRVGQTINLP
jgi:nucleoid-associated protein YgaU